MSASLTERDCAKLLDYSSRSDIPDAISGAIRRALRELTLLRSRDAMRHACSNCGPCSCLETD